MIISFAWTTPALLAGRKTVTRRFWKDDYARRMIQHAIVQGRPVDAYNKSPQWGGKKIAQLRIMSIRKERLGLLLEDPSYGNEEMEKEGGDMFWVDLKDFVGAWSHSFNPDCEMWRIEFEVLELTK